MGTTLNAGIPKGSHLLNPKPSQTQENGTHAFSIVKVLGTAWQHLGLTFHLSLKVRKKSQIPRTKIWPVRNVKLRF